MIEEEQRRCVGEGREYQGPYMQTVISEQQDNSPRPAATDVDR
jgi:hypothetical protein